MKHWAVLLGVGILCSVEAELNIIRPGAEYIVRSGDLAGIEWTDKVQVKPTQTEMNAAYTTCLANYNAALASKITATAAAKNSGLTDAQRIDAIISVLGL